MINFSPLERLNAIRDLRCVHGTEKAVLAFLALRVDAQQQCWPSMATIADDSGLGVTAAREAVRRLVAGGFVARHDRSGRSTVFSINDATIRMHLPDPSASRTPPPAGPLRETKGYPSAKRTPPLRETDPTPPPDGPEGVQEGDQEEVQVKEPNARARPGLVSVGGDTEGYALAEAYAETVREATGNTFPLPRFGDRDLANAARAHAPPGHARARVEWMREQARLFVAATRGENNGYNPRRFVDWLNAGRPSNGNARSRARELPKSVAEPTEWKEADLDEEEAKERDRVGVAAR